MTAWQDQPPVSRRQVRQSERGDAAESPVRLAQNPTDQPDFGPFARESWNSDSASPAEPPARADGVVVRGRRAQLKFPTSAAHDEDAPEESSDAAAPEPLSYITNGRPQVPSYDGPSFRGRGISAVPDSTADASADAEQGDSDGSYRLRDFSPESRRSTFTAVNRPQGSNPVNTKPSELEYHTQAAPPAEEPTPEAPSAETPARDEAPRSERTMTRRELRALQQRNDPLPFDAQPSHAPSTEPIRTRERSTEQVAVNDAVDAAVPPALVEPPVLVEPLKLSSFPLFVAPVDPAAPAIEIAHVVAEVSIESDTADEVISAEIVEDEPHTSLPDFDALLFQAPRSPSEPVDAEPIPMPGNTEEKPFGLLLQEPDAPVENPFGLFHDLDAGEAAAPDARQNDEPVARDEPIARDESIARVDEPAQDDELAAREAYTPPVGHWSTQASIDDDEQLVENSFSRNVGTTGSITTSALVLPTTPDGILAPLSSTGEILITGSINLPSSLGTTGALPARYDHSDVDALLAAGDREDSDPDSAPVRAIRAISTHTASGPLISTVKPKNNNRMLTVVAVSAAVVAAGIVALLIAGVVFKIF